MSRLSAIIVHFGSAERTRACLHSLLASSLPPDEIVVVDNDGSVNLSNSLACVDARVKVLPYLANFGYSRAINIGMRHASGELLLLLNPDVVLDVHATRHAVSCLTECPDIGVVGPRVLNLDGSVQDSVRSFPRWHTLFANRTSLLSRYFPGNPLTRSYLKPDASLGSGTVPVDWVSGCCLFVRRQALERIGGMDERYFLFMEDVDLCWRLRQDGSYRVHHLPQATVTHEIGISNAVFDPQIIRHRHASIRLFIDRYYQARPRLLRAAGKLLITLRERMLLMRAVLWRKPAVVPVALATGTPESEA